MRGMYGDETSSGGTTTTTVTDPNGDTQNDYNWLSGEVMEADTYNLVNGVQTIEKKDISLWPNAAGFNQTASQDQPSNSGLPALTANMIAQSESESLLLQADGSYKTGTNTDYYNGNGLVIAADHDPQGLTETCVTTTYATPPSGNSMMESYPAQVTNVTGGYNTTTNACPAATASDIVSDSKTY